MELKETIKSAIEGCNAKHLNPTFAHVSIMWNNDKETEEAIIKLNTDVIVGEDEEITYYCENINELLQLCENNKNNPSDFVITEFYGFSEMF